MASDIAIEHQAERRRFVARIDGGEAEISYTEPRGGVLDLQHTFVPPAARGRGVAGRLVEYAVDYARARDQKIIPTCRFVRAWTREHPEARDVLAE